MSRKISVQGKGQGLEKDYFRMFWKFGKTRATVA